MQDVTLLRKQIAAVDRRLKQMRVAERLPDDERREAILQRHYRLAPGPAGGAGSVEAGGRDSLEALAAEMEALKLSLLGMGQRVQAQVAEDAAALGH